MNETDTEAAAAATDRIEAQARRANRADLWDRLWSKAETRDWRREALSRVYTRIERLLPVPFLIPRAVALLFTRPEREEPR